MHAQWWLLAAVVMLVVVGVHADVDINGFDKDFGWCAASASYQVEGGANEDGRGPSVWDTYSKDQNGKNIFGGVNGDVSADSYHRYKEDVQLLKNMSVKFYRFSIAWSRIIPTGHYVNESLVNQKGLDYYENLLNELDKANIKPMVTLFHWDTPQGIETDYGGWRNRLSVNDFVAYAEVVFKKFARRVPFWITFNEPWCSCIQGYSTLIKAPGLTVAPAIDGYLCSHNQLLAHGYTVKLYREKYQRLYNANGKHGTIGITLNSEYAVPATDSPADRAAAERYMTFLLGFYGDPVYFGDYPRDMKLLIGDRLPKFTKEEKAMLRGSSEFFGFNAYTTVVVQDAPLGNPGPLANWEHDRHVSASHQFPNGSYYGTAAASGWLYYAPYGFQYYLEWISRRYGYPPIMVTENGVSVPNEHNLPVDQAKNDKFRVAFYRGYIKAMHQAMQNGAKVTAYCAWSLLDNFEWADGFINRFGLVHVALGGDQKRTPKLSAEYFGAVIRGEENLNNTSLKYQYTMNATALPFDI